MGEAGRPVPGGRGGEGGRRRGGTAGSVPCRRREGAGARGIRPPQPPSGCQRPRVAAALLPRAIARAAPLRTVGTVERSPQAGTLRQAACGCHAARRLQAAARRQACGIVPVRRAAPRQGARRVRKRTTAIPASHGRAFGGAAPAVSPAGRGFTLACEFDRGLGPRAASKCALTRRACGASRPMREPQSGGEPERAGGEPDRRNAPACGWGHRRPAAHAGSLAHGQPSMQRRPPIPQTGSSGSSSSGQARSRVRPRRGAVARAPYPRGSLPAPPHRPRIRSNSAAQAVDNVPGGPERQGPAPRRKGATLCTGREGLSPVQP